MRHLLDKHIPIVNAPGTYFLGVLRDHCHFQ